MWIGRINIVKLTILAKAINRFYAIPNQISNGIFHRTRTKNLKICMETLKIPKSQNSLAKEKWSWRNQAPRFQTIQTIKLSHQNSVVLAQKYKYKSMEKDWKFRNKPIHLQSINLWQRRQYYTMLVGKTVSLKWFWEHWTVSIHKNKLKMDKGLNVRQDSIKLLEENIEHSSDINQSNIFFDSSPRIKEIRT